VGKKEQAAVRTMSSPWTTERILALAPDPASAKAGQGLANPRKWVALGQSERLLWGECQGSGASPYQTQIDLSEPAFKCSCPSRKFPCKHGLGLLLMLGPQVPAVKGVPPEWVIKWITSRDQKQEAKKEKSEKPAEIADPAAQARRAADRLAKVSAGLADLNTWLQDLIRNGFAVIPGDAKFFDQPAARLVDAQAPGAARLVREIASIHRSGNEWPAQMLDQAARLFLLIEAFQRVDDLPVGTQADVRTLLGMPMKEEEVLAEEGVRDTWLVLGQKTEEEDRLRTQRTWLIGKTTGRAGLILEFSYAGQPLKSTLVAGSSFDAELAFYRSAFPLRAIIKQRHPEIAMVNAAAGHPGIQPAIEAYGAAIALHPWIERFPLSLQNVTPVRHHNRWMILDSGGHALPLAPRYAHAWELLAISGGSPISLFGEFDGRSLFPVSAIAEGTFYALG
jgi:SWIM zinc finger